MLLIPRRSGVALAARALRAMTRTRPRGISDQPRGSTDPMLIRSQEEMEALGSRLASCRRSGDVIFLRGDLGCGKTCFARGFIRALTNDPTLHVTSPTYLLVNTYEMIRETIAPHEARKAEVEEVYHIDLYRLDTVSAVDAQALGLTDAFERGIALVEWPQRLQTSGIPNERLEVSIDYDEHDATLRHVQLHGHGARWVSSLGLPETSK